MLPEAEAVKSLRLHLMAQGGRICLQRGRSGFDPWVGMIPWRRERLPTPVFWPGDSHGLYSPWGRKESDATERPLHFTCLSAEVPGPAPAAWRVSLCPPDLDTQAGHLEASQAGRTQGIFSQRNQE